MPILQTNIQKENAKFPTRLEVLRELGKRGALDDEMKKELYKLELGNCGEQTVLKWLQEFGLNHWRVVRNLWLYRNGNFECDLILLTTAKICHFEIKNYTKDFAYQSGQCYFDGEKMSHNTISQAQRVFINFENILRNENIHVPLESIIVFASQHSEVNIKDTIQDVTIKTLNQLRDYIFQIAADEKSYRGERLDIRHFMQLIEKYEVANPPFQAEPITKETEHRLQKGILCSQCGSFDIDTSKSLIVCDCGMCEPRENAIIRTICEYGVIHFDKELVTADVLDFFDQEISRNTLFKYLDKHFERVGNNRGLHFINKTIPIKRCYVDFDLKNHRSLIIRGY